MLIGITLAIMFIITLLSVVGGNTFISILHEHTIDSSAIVNGSTTQFEIDYTEQAFGLDPITGGIALIITLAAIGAIIGLQIVGSGLSENSVKIILLSIFYGGLWAILSLLSYNLIVAIDTFGGMIYLVLTILFAIGVANKYFGDKSD